MAKKNSNNDDIVLEPSDEESGEENLRQKIKDLKEKFDVCAKERTEYLAGWQRARADYVNLEKESIKRRAEGMDAGSEQVLADIIPVLDSFELAFSNKDAWNATPENWRRGIEYIHMQLKAVLEGYDLMEICPKPGDALQFEHHAVVESIPADSPEQDGTVAAVLQKGYLHKGKVLRAARVNAFSYRQ